ncbi:sigma-70 family RNA polymerase sigma factor [Pedobacter sp. N36a]|uniref:RNA polymerase sigma factor n=1 Tax=Pedobacter sp. N36a TaxID=2767996 RepID=UPI001657226C|nr:sigma-70 family RNA polymerase sigma factor [Pedobacter sp. N36a]MBC8988003.1 sigma-70 family RNA polymerase sigma factor [Pedobacter sp. N36a]
MLIHSSDILVNESDLLTKVAGGDHQAFRVIYQRYYNKIYTFSIRILHSQLLAEEAVQESMLKLWLMGPNLMAINNLDSYLKRIARNCAIDILRRKELELRTDRKLGVIWEETHNETEEQVLLNDMRKVLNDGVALLPRQQKLVYQLCHQEGLKYEEAALRLNLSVLTVQSYMKLALRFLRNYLKTHTDIAVLLIIFKLL